MSLATLSLVILTSTLPVTATNSRPADEVTASRNPLFARLRLDLFDRTYPDFASRAQRYDGPVLYPGYIDLSGVVSIEGPYDTLKVISDELNAAPGQPPSSGGGIVVAVNYLGSRSSVASDRTQQGTSVSHKEIAISPVSGQEFRWRFTVPVSNRALWKDGLYRIQATVPYSNAGREAVLATRSLSFEIITLKKGSGDEINLYTNAALNQPEGFGLKLFKLDPEFRGMKPYQRILTLDSGDVFAKKIIARIALHDARPEAALEMYRQILTDLEAGRARRIESLVDMRHLSPRDLAPHDRILPKNKQEWAQYVRTEIQGMESAVNHVEDARRKVTGAMDQQGAAVLDGLLSDDDMFVQLLAVREAKKRALLDARGPLLDALPRCSRPLQKEIVNALAAIQGKAEPITVDTFPEDQERIINAWASTRPNDD
jgi:hypothetical protein